MLGSTEARYSYEEVLTAASAAVDMLPTPDDDLRELIAFVTEAMLAKLDPYAEDNLSIQDVLEIRYSTTAHDQVRKALYAALKN